ncbi:hypothetical protein FHX06_007186 [Rhizobium sp. BK512]|jgi:hypothetical protein|nr:hypothetical protein [Rhizobium sp. BK379]MBB3565813.1 hypothetical protein [Rhizobium sp. BK512]
MRYYVRAIHTDDTRNRLTDSRTEATAMEEELQNHTRPGDNYFIKMSPA